MSRRMLEIGSQGEDVVTLQSLLEFDPDDIDGIFGGDTRAAVIEFQEENDLEADGIVGPLTWEALLDTSAPEKPEVEQEEQFSEPHAEVAHSYVSETLGSLSKKYESGNCGPGTVSTGRGDAGGVSYGTYQMISRGGEGSTAALFVRSCNWTCEFQGLAPGSPAFTSKWKQIANGPEGREFGLAQHDYIKRTHYDPAVKKLLAQGVDLTQRSKTMQDVIWSRAVQHGPSGAATVITRALAGRKLGDLDDAAIINLIYDECSNTSRYFSRNSQAVQASVRRRLNIDERRDALSRLQAELTRQ